MSPGLLARRAAGVASAALCLVGAVLWSLPMLASGLLVLLRYGFGSIFVVGERATEVLLASAGAGIAASLQHMHADPALASMEAAAGLVLSAAASSLALRQPLAAATLAALSAGEAWWYDTPLTAAVLAGAAACAIGAIGLRRG